MKNKQKNKVDYFLLIISAILIIWGIFTVGTTSFFLSLKNFGQPWYYLSHQLLILGLGLLLAFVAYRQPLTKIQKIAPYLFLGNLLLLFLVFIPGVGVKSGGASRWISIFGFPFQPSEFLKLTSILYLSSWLSTKTKSKVKPENKVTDFFQTLLPFVIIMAVLILALILQPDMTTLGIICFTGFLMYFSANVPWWHTIVLLVTGTGAFALFLKTSAYRLARFMSFLNPANDPMGVGYQLKQASIAIGSGKIFGIAQGFGFGLSRQKFGFLPEAITDSIFAIVGEELGFIGASLLVVLFFIFLVKGITIALRHKQCFARFVALGITIWISFQALLNIGGITGVLPMGGIPLPFFSYGGSHLLTEVISIGLLLNISKS